MKKLLLLLLLLFTTLYASTIALLSLVPNGESLNNFNNTYYIDNRSPINAIAISEDGKYIVSGSYDNSIKIWDSNKTRALKSLIGGQRGNWLVKNHENNKFYRGDDGTLLLDKKTFKPVQAQWYVEQKSVDDVKLSVKNRQLKFNNNQKAKLMLQLKNLDQNP